MSDQEARGVEAERLPTLITTPAPVKAVGICSICEINPSEPDDPDGWCQECINDFWEAEYELPFKPPKQPRFREIRVIGNDEEKGKDGGD